MGKNRTRLVAIMSHAVFESQAEVMNAAGSTFEGLSIEDYRQLVESLLRQGFRFVTPVELTQESTLQDKCALLTFDDGYYNNLRILPVLHEFSVPAVFFISTNHVLQNRAFWWDVVIRCRAQQGVSRTRTLRERNYLKTLRHEQIEAYLLREFGASALIPTGDLDRALTPRELRSFATDPYVVIGNHTADHAILTCYPQDQMLAQIV